MHSDNPLDLMSTDDLLYELSHRHDGFVAAMQKDNKKSEIKVVNSGNIFSNLRLNTEIAIVLNREIELALEEEREDLD